MKSQNGWPASPDKAAIGVVRLVVPGTDIDFPQGVKDGDVKTVLGYVAEQFHKTVEPLVDGWCWGFGYRAIEGSTSLSNHSSGTAIDLNAPRHPMGAANSTFTYAQRRAIRTILSYCENVVRWGGDFDGRKDDMHFEIVGTPEQVARIAKKIRGDLTPAPRLRRPWPTYMKAGHYFGLISGPAASHGGYYLAERPDVKAIQQRLIVLGYVPGVTSAASSWADGKFEQPTKDAVARWQRAKYAASTTRYGEVWSDDWRRLFTY